MLKPKDNYPTRVTSVTFSYIKLDKDFDLRVYKVRMKNKTGSFSNRQLYDQSQPSKSTQKRTLEDGRAAQRKGGGRNATETHSCININS